MKVWSLGKEVKMVSSILMVESILVGSIFALPVLIPLNIIGFPVNIIGFYDGFPIGFI